MEDWRINRTSLRRFGVDSCKEFAVTLTLTAYKSVSLCVFSSWRFWAQTITRVWINVCSGCWREREEVKRRTRGRLWLKSARSDFLLVYWFFRPLLFSLTRSLLPSQSDSDESRPSGASKRLIFLPHLLIPQLCSVFKTLRFLLGASNKEYTVTGEEKEEKERADVTRYQWNQIYLTCPWATFIFQVDVKKLLDWLLGM